MFDRFGHCEDEALLAWLDGELPEAEAAELSRHLSGCAECRERSREVQHDLECVAALAKASSPGAAEVAAAKRRFRAWAGAQEQACVLPAPRKRRFPVWPMAAAASVAAMLLGGWWLLRRPEPATTALARVESAEASLARGPVHQVFEVKVVETRPVQRETAGRFEVWSDGGGRYAGSFRYDDGSVVLAQAPTPVVALYRLPEHSYEALVREFVHWVRSRPWRPVALSQDLALFVREDGAKLGAETFEDVIRFTAERERDGARVQFVLTVDRRTGQPRSQTLRFLSAARAIELRMAVLEYAAYKRIDPKVFAPAPEPLPEKPARPRGADAEVEVRYALHRTQACRNEILEVAEMADGRIRVRGVVPDAARRASLLARLGEWPVAAEISVGQTAGRLNDPAYLAYQEGLALVRLAEAFPAARYARLPEESRARIQAMVHDHAVAARTQLALASKQPVPGASEPDLAPNSTWNARCFALFRAIDRLDSALQENAETEALFRTAIRQAEILAASRR